MDEQTPPTPPDQPEPPPEPRRRLERSRDDRMLSGVCGGIARYVGIDANVVRIVTVGLVLLGGAGVLLYLAALLLMPEQGESGPSFSLGAFSGEGGRGQALTVLGVVVLGLLAFAGIAVVGTVVGWILFPLAFLVIIGLFAWWIASGERPAGSTGEILKRAALGLGLLAVCLALALGGVYATAAGSGVVGAALVLGAGAVLVAAAFTRPARWLILPALSLGLAAGFVTATGIELDGGIGEREYRPAAVGDLREKYQLGVGEMVVDLRDIDLPAGDRRLKIEMGVGDAVVLVREDVCVATTADVGMGAVDAFDSESEGIDVRHDDERTAPSGTPRLVLEGDVGIGLLEVHHERPDHGRGGDDRHGWDERNDLAGGNEACVGGTANAGGGGSDG